MRISWRSIGWALNRFGPVAAVVATAAWSATVLRSPRARSGSAEAMGFSAVRAMRHVQVVAFGFVGDELVQLCGKPGDVARAQPRAQVVVEVGEEAEVHFSGSGDAQAVAAGAEGFFVGGDDADAAGVVGVAVFARGAGVFAPRLELPALRYQVLLDGGGGNVLRVEKIQVVARLHQFDKAQGNGARFHKIDGIGQGLGNVFAQQ